MFFFYTNYKPFTSGKILIKNKEEKKEETLLIYKK